MNLFYMISLNDKVNRLVIDGKIDEALSLLEEIAPSFDNDVTLLKSNYAELVDNEMLGTISSEDLRLEMNKLRRSILLLTDRIEENTEAVITPKHIIPSPEHQNKKSKKLLYFGLAFAAMIIIYYLPEPNNSTSNSNFNPQGTASIPATSNHIPLPAFPQDGSEIPQPFEINWNFQWDEPHSVKDIEFYQLRVFGSNALSPAIDTLVNDNFFETSDECSHIPSQFINGWRWQVRSKLFNGTWSEWSNSNTFNVEDFDEPTFCIYCPYLCSDEDQ